MNLVSFIKQTEIASFCFIILLNSWDCLFSLYWDFLLYMHQSPNKGLIEISLENALPFLKSCSFSFIWTERGNDFNNKSLFLMYLSFSILLYSEFNTEK